MVVVVVAAAGSGWCWWKLLLLLLLVEEEDDGGNDVVVAVDDVGGVWWWWWWQWWQWWRRLLWPYTQPPPPTHTYTHARRRSRSLSGSVTFSLACTFLGVTLEDDDLLSHRIGKTLVRDGQFLSATDAGLRIGTGKQTSTAAPQQQAIIHMHFAAYRDACV
jgi:hypothetical protein